ncbi:MAG: 50S ribosomal protein L11 methyltransferase [Eubacteriales bacterium]|nr:50S ribosomal protein L11 methyltransferase [Eubacteriales bacterium]
MNWLELTVLTTTEASDLISEVLISAGSQGVMIEDKNDVSMNQRPEGQWDIIDEEIARRIGDDVKVTGYYPIDERIQDTMLHIEAELRRIAGLGLEFDLGKLQILRHTVDEEDWAESWKKSFKPFRLGSHMLVKPSWEQCDAAAEDKIIEIDPGMAFGTGTHETTGMCVELVEKNVKPGMKVIDVGTGTGILAIAAAHMGASDVLAIDLDAVAVRVAAENVRKNGFEKVIAVRQGDLLEAVEAVADVVIANIIADVIIMLAAPVKAHIVPGGLFICSGIAREKKDGVLKALDDAGYAIQEIAEKGEWAAIAARRP